MEERVYDKDPYCRSCEGTVLWCRPAQKQGKTVYEAAFDRVLFYPEGGGQPSDTGTAGEARVLEAHQREGQVVCTLDRPPSHLAEQSKAGLRSEPAPEACLTAIMEL